MIDCHCHLQTLDVPSVCRRAASLGVECIVSVAETPSQQCPISSPFIPIANCVGLHPLQPSPNGDPRPVSVTAPLFEQNRHAIASAAIHCAGVGEVGLDFSPFISKAPDGHAQMSEQTRVFVAQIHVANSVAKTLNVHSRSASRQAIETLRSFATSARVLLHAFDGASKSARLAIESGFYFSFPPSFVAADVRWLDVVPLDRLVLETDAPALALKCNALTKSLNSVSALQEGGVDPFGANEPACVRTCVEFLAARYATAPEEVIAATTATARSLFPPPLWTIE